MRNHTMTDSRSFIIPVGIVIQLVVRHMPPTVLALINAVPDAVAAALITRVCNGFERM